MVFALKVFFVFLLLIALCGWMGRFWKGRYSFEPGYTQVHFAETEDGWRIALFRYLPEKRKHPTPVVLCHGLGANRFNFDLGEERSLARYLRNHGFEVWTLDLRGRGLSTRQKKGNGSYRGPSAFDDYVQKDAPAVISHVKRETGSQQVHWVGHSMGGLILYALLQGKQARDIASGVAVASPGSFAPIRKIPLVYTTFRLLRYLPRVHQSFFAAGLAPLLARSPKTLMSIAVNPNNMEPLMMKRALCHLVSDMTKGEILQFSDWIGNHEFRTLDKGYSYESNFGSIQKPLMLIAGSRDYLCAPESVVATYDRIASERKKLYVLGRENGQEREYGHGDLLVGKRCEEEVFPLILDWLEEPEVRNRVTEAA